MKRLCLAFFLLLLQNFCFGQSRVIDSLKAELKNASEDTARLDIYLALGKASERQNKLLYADSAWKLLDKLFAYEKKEDSRQKLIETESGLPYLITGHYSNNDTIDWNKAMPYLINRLQAIEKEGDKKRAANFLFNMAVISVDMKKDSASFRTYMLKSIDDANEIKDSALIIEGYSFMNSFYKSAGNFSLSLDAAQNSMAVCRQLNYKKGIAVSHIMLAGLYADYGEDELALNNYQAALDIAYKIKDTVQIFYTLIPLGGFYSIRNVENKALEYLNKILELCSSNLNLAPKLGEVYRMIGQLYSDNKDYKNALASYEKSLAKSEELKDANNIVIVMNEIGNLYNYQGDFDKAVSYHNRSIHMADSVEELKRILGYFQYYLAKDYYDLKKYSDAKKINNIALFNFKKNVFDVNFISKMELLAAQIDSARGDGFGAFAHYKAYVSLMEKSRGDEIRKAAQKDTFKAEMEKQKKEQEKKDAIAKLTRNLQYLAIGAFLLLGIFLLYGYIQKNKDNKRIEKAYGELKSTQAQLIQSEKMASLGELTAGIAHEIQNPLNFVNNFSEVNTELIDELEQEADKGNIDEIKLIAKDIKENSGKINHHGKRADAIVKGMLQHSRTSSGQKELTDLNALADEYLRLSYHGLRAKDKNFNAHIKTDFDESIGKINIIPQDIGRVLLNLYNNAFYAVAEKKKQQPEGYEPTVSVSTKKVGDKVLLSVTDNGNGIPQKIVDKIFQPFFTTKPTGQGTGLGLSLSYDIIKAHGGEIKVESKGGEGTAFIIQLPVNS